MANSHVIVARTDLDWHVYFMSSADQFQMDYSSVHGPGPLLDYYYMLTLVLYFFNKSNSWLFCDVALTSHLIDRFILYFNFWSRETINSVPASIWWSWLHNTRIISSRLHTLQFHSLFQVFLLCSATIHFHNTQYSTLAKYHRGMIMARYRPLSIGSKSNWSRL